MIGDPRPHILTADEFNSMSPRQRQLRQLQWTRIIARLRLEHRRRYHSPRHAIALRQDLLARLHESETP